MQTQKPFGQAGDWKTWVLATVLVLGLLALVAVIQAGR